MSHFGIFVLILFAIIAFHKVNCKYNSAKCDSEVCNDVCKKFSLTGECVDNECRCSTDKVCIDFACDKFCDALGVGLEGECDENGICICKPKLEICSKSECQESCEEDPRARKCMIVVADFCLDYGPIRTCSCICYTWPWPWLNQINHILPTKAKMLLSKNSSMKKFIQEKSPQNFYSVIRPKK